MLARILLLAFPPLVFIGSAGMDIALSSIAVLFLVHSAMTRDWQWLQAKWLKIAALLWLYMLARSAFADMPHEALRRSAPFVRYFVFAAALSAWVMLHEKMRRAFLISLGATLAFIMADGLLQWVTGTDLFGRITAIDAAGHIRLTGPFAQTKPIMGIVLAWLSFPVSLYLLLAGDGTPKRGKALLPGIAFALSALAMIALSGERMALLLALLGWGIALLCLKLNLKRLLLLAACGAGLMGAMALAIPSMFDRQVMATIDTFKHWQDSPYGKILTSDLKLATLSPLVGVGPNHFRITCPEIYPGADEATLKGVCNIHPHNIYLEWLIECGVIGLALFIALIASILCRAMCAWKNAGASPLLLGWGIAFALRIWPIGSTTGFFSNWGAPPFWLALGMLLVYTVQEKEPHNVNTSVTV